MWDEFWLRVLIVGLVILWSVFSVAIFLLLVRLTFIWFEDFTFFHIYFAPA